MYKRSIVGWAKHWDFILLDTLCLQLAFALAYYIRFHTFAVYTIIGNRTTYRTSGIILLFLSIVVSILFNTMNNVLRRGILEEIKCTIVQAGLVFAAIVVLLFTDKASNHVSRIVLYATVGIYAALSILTRLIYKQILIKYMKASKSNSILLVGDREGIEKALKAFGDHPESGINVKGIVVVDDAVPSSELTSSSADSADSPRLSEGNDGRKLKEIDGIPVVADTANAAKYILNEWIDNVYIACMDYSLIPDELIVQCDEMAVTVHQQMFPNKNVKGKQWLEKIAKQPVITTSINIPKPQSLIIKRIFDLIAGIVLCLAALLELLIVTPIIKIISPGPVLLRLERIGQNGKKFKMYMIRTMYMDAGSRDDKVIKGVGQFLRRSGLDELPKGFNILLGQMSLVGTRAPSPTEWETYEYHHRARLSCKPGLTGLWQASGRSKTMDFEEATAIDTEYIMNWSLGLDLRILFRTAALKQ